MVALVLIHLKDNMSYIDKEGYLQTSDEEKEALRHGLPKNWAKDIINWIIWGDDKHFYEEK